MSATAPATQDLLEAALAVVDGVRRATATQLVEIVRVCAGTKPAIRLVVEDDELGAVSAQARRLELFVAPARVRLREVQISAAGDVYTVAVPWEAPDRAPFAVYLGPRAVAEACADAESSGAPSVDLGGMLGIPGCCASAYRRIQAGDPWLSTWLAGTAPGEILDASANHLATYLAEWSPAGEYMPCSAHCARTSVVAREGLSAAREVGLRSLCDLWAGACRRPVCVLDEDLIFLPESAGPAPFVVERPASSVRVHGPRRAELEGRLACAHGLLVTDGEVASIGGATWRAPARVVRFGDVEHAR